MPDKGDDVKNRFAERFEKDEQAEKSEQTENEQQAKTVKKDKKGRQEKKANIKSSWTNHSVYLNDELAGELGRQYKYLDLELDEEFGMSIQKTRHYYPLIVKLGLERLDSLPNEDIKERIDELSRGDR
jgi:hypothetical protein